MRYVLTILLLGAGVMWGCSSDTGGTLATEWEDCQITGATGCGRTEAGEDAVLICSETGVWLVSEVCPGGCATEAAACLGIVPSQDIKDKPDVVSPLPDVAADAGKQDTGKDSVDPEEMPVFPDDVEIVFVDLIPDYEPPWVESTSPADDEMGVALPAEGEDFVVTVVFTEPIHEPTIAETTVKVKDAVGTLLNLEYAFTDDDTTILEITFKGAVFPSSPYTVILEPMIKDLAGNQMGNNYQFTFYTAATGSLTKYFELAGKFAPAIYQETNPGHPEYDYPTKYNLDGDWVAADNVDYIVIDAVKVEPHVYYSVIETKSHFFIQYIFYWPYRYAETESNRFGNDVSGAMVLVRKSDEAPIALETYFKKDLDERSLSFVTTDSGLITADGTFTSHKFDGSYEEADLFPNGHYLAYLSAREHESCLWLDENNNYMDGCVLNAGVKGTMKKIELKYKGAPTVIEKTGGKFPQELTDVGYGISHLLESWWPRRNDVGDNKMWGSTYSYEPFVSTIFKDRPGIKEPMPSVFVDPIGNDNGRPPWAWRYYPQNGTTFYEMPRGVWFLDAAVHFKQRHDQGNKWAEFDGVSGWSIEYCYNPFFNLDFRNIWPECTTK